MKLILLIGPSGVGKSTYASNIKEPHVVCSADNFFMKDGIYTFDPKQLNYAHQECLWKATVAMSQGKIVVVDNTNTRFSDFSEYIRCSTFWGYTVLMTFFDIPDDPTVLLRNLHGVPIETINKQIARIKQMKKTIKRDIKSRFPGTIVEYIDIK